MVADEVPDLRPRLFAGRARGWRRVGLAGLVIVLILARPAQSAIAPAAVATAAVVELAVELGARGQAAWRDHTADLRTGYQGGRARTIQVVRIGGHDLEVGTARAFATMRDAAATAGVELRISSGFRSVDEQAVLYQAWRQRRGARAALPGRSNHQSGRAIDLFVSLPGARAWLTANASSFGFVRTVRGEPWHWEHIHAPRAMAAAPRARIGRAHRRTGRGRRSPD